MIEVSNVHPCDVPPGLERRALKRELRMKISSDDFSEEEWVEIEAEAPGTRSAIEAGPGRWLEATCE